MDVDGIQSATISRTKDAFFQRITTASVEALWDMYESWTPGTKLSKRQRRARQIISILRKDDQNREANMDLQDLGMWISDESRATVNRRQEELQRKLTRREKEEICGGIIYCCFTETFEFYVGSTIFPRDRIAAHFENLRRRLWKKRHPGSLWYPYAETCKKHFFVVLRCFEFGKDCRIGETFFIRMLKPRFNVLGVHGVNERQVFLENETKKKRPARKRPVQHIRHKQGQGPAPSFTDEELLRPKYLRSRFARDESCNALATRLGRPDVPGTDAMYEPRNYTVLCKWLAEGKGRRLKYDLLEAKRRASVAFAIYEVYYTAQSTLSLEQREAVDRRLRIVANMRGVPLFRSVQYRFSYQWELEALKAQKEWCIFWSHPEVADHLRYRVSWKFIKTVEPRQRELFRLSRGAAKAAKRDDALNGFSPAATKVAPELIEGTTFSAPVGPLYTDRVRGEMARMQLQMKRNKGIEGVLTGPEVVLSAAIGAKEIEEEEWKGRGWKAMDLLLAAEVRGDVIVQSDKSKNRGFRIKGEAYQRDLFVSVDISPRYERVFERTRGARAKRRKAIDVANEVFRRRWGTSGKGARRGVRLIKLPYLYVNYKGKCHADREFGRHTSCGKGPPHMFARRVVSFAGCFSKGDRRRIAQAVKRINTAIDICWNHCCHTGTSFAGAQAAVAADAAALAPCDGHCPGCQKPTPLNIQVYDATSFFEEIELWKLEKARRFLLAGMPTGPEKTQIALDLKLVGAFADAFRYVSVGDQVYVMTPGTGVPIGGPFSSTVSKLVLSAGEHRDSLRPSPHANNSKCKCRRYEDDVLATTLFCHDCCGVAIKRGYWHDFEREKSTLEKPEISWLEYLVLIRNNSVVLKRCPKDDERYRLPWKENADFEYLRMVVSSRIARFPTEENFVQLMDDLASVGWSSEEVRKVMYTCGSPFGTKDIKKRAINTWWANNRKPRRRRIFA